MSNPQNGSSRIAYYPIYLKGECGDVVAIARIYITYRDSRMPSNRHGWIGLMHIITDEMIDRGMITRKQATVMQFNEYTQAEAETMEVFGICPIINVK